MKRLFIFLTLLLAPLARGQQTTVTATVTDPVGKIYAFGTGSATLVCPGNQQPTYHGFTVPRTITITGLDGFGTFSQKLYDVNAIDQGGCGYKFAITDVSTVYSFTTGLITTVTGASVNLSAAISAFSVLLPVTSLTQFLTLNNTFTGTNTFNNTVTFNSTVIFGVLPTFPSQSSNTFFAAPSGGAGVPTFRLIAPVDVPPVSLTSTGNGGVTSTGTTSGHLATWTAGGALQDGGTGSGGTVSSVGLAAPPEINVTNTPVTSSGTLTQAWQPQVANMVLASPATGTIGGTMDGNASPIGTSTSASATLTPSTTHDWAFSVVQTTGQSSHPTMPGGWVLQNTNGANGDVFTQEFNTGAAITATQTLGASASWADQTFLLTLNATPVVVQTCGTNGGFAGTGIQCTLNTSNTVVGNSIIVALYGVPPSTTAVSGNFTDTAGNTYTPINFSQNGANQYIITALASNIIGGVKPVVTFVPTVAGSFSSSEFYAAEVSGVNLTNGKPGFRRLQLTDMPPQLQAPPVSVFTNQNLGGDVAVSAATLTTVDTLTMTMPTNGCPCRILVTYSYGWIYTTSGGVDFYVDDGTNQFVKSESKSTSAGSLVGGTTATGFSPTTYANGAVVSLAVKTKGEQAYTIKVAAFVAGPSSYVQGAVFTSK